MDSAFVINSKSPCGYLEWLTGQKSLPIHHKMQTFSILFTVSASNIWILHTVTPFPSIQCLAGAGREWAVLSRVFQRPYSFSWLPNILQWISGAWIEREETESQRKEVVHGHKARERLGLPVRPPTARSMFFVPHHTVSRTEKGSHGYSPII